MRKLNKFISIVGVVLITFFMFNLSLFAQTDNEPRVYINDVVIESGNSKYLYVYYSHFDSVASVEVTITFNELMTVTNVFDGDYFNGMVSDSNIGSGYITYQLVSVSGISGSGTLFSFLMNTNDLPIGSYEIDVFIGEAYKTNLEPVSIQSGFSRLNVTEKQTQTFYGYFDTYVSKAAVKQNETFELFVHMNSSVGFSSGKVKIQYDKEQLRVNLIQIANQFSSADIIYSLNNEIEGMIIFTFVSLYNLSYINEMIKVDFESLVNINEVTNIDVYIDEASNQDLDTIVFDKRTVSVQLQETIEEIVIPKLYLTNHIGFSKDQFEVFVKIDQGTNIAAGDFYISYDAFYFELISIEAGNQVRLNGGIIMYNPTYQYGQIKFSYINENGLDGSDTLLKLVLKANYDNFNFISKMSIGSNEAPVDEFFSPVVLDYVFNTIDLSEEITYQFYDYDGTLIESIDLRRDQEITYPITTPRTNTTFNSWVLVEGSKDVITYQATYDLDVNAVSMTSLEKVYDGTNLVPSITSDVRGVLITTDYVPFSEVGHKEVKVSVFLDDIYQFTETVEVSITKKPLTLSINEAMMTYSETPNYQYQLGELVFGDVVDVSLTTDSLDVGKHLIMASIDNKNYELNYNEAYLTVIKAVYDLSEISFTNQSVVYDGNQKDLRISGSLPSGVKVSYTNNGHINVGSYEVLATFSGDAKNYELIPDMKATLSITKQEISLAGIKLNDQTFKYDGSEKTVTIEGTLPDFIRVSYLNHKQTNVGVYVVEALFSVTDDNYTVMPKLEAILTIEKGLMTGLSMADLVTTYDGKIKTLSIVGINQTMTVTYLTAYEFTDSGTYLIEAEVSKPSYETVKLSATLNITKASYDLSNISFDDVSYIYDGLSKYNHINGTLPSGVTVSYVGDGVKDVGTYEVKALFSGDTKNYELMSDLSSTLTITKATYDLSNITFLDQIVTYDGLSKNINIKGILPAGVSVTYTGNGNKQVGSYEVKAIFSGDTKNYELMPELTAQLTIIESAFVGVSIENKTVTYDGLEKKIEVVGLETGTRVSYPNGNTFTDAGTYVIKAVIEREGYESLSLEAILTIEKAVYDLSNITLDNQTFVYDGKAKELLISGVLPTGVTVSYVGNQVSDAGIYTVIASFSGDDKNYERISPLSATLTIEKAVYDLSNITFEDQSVIYDGVEKDIYIKGTLPSGVSVSYLGNGNINVGTYEVKAIYSGDDKNYELISDRTATLTITKAVYDLSNITFEDQSVIYDGLTKNIYIKGILPAGVSVSYLGNGIKAVGNYEVIAQFSGDTKNYELIPERHATLTIIESAFTGVSIENMTEVYDGTPKTLTVTGVETGTRVSYPNGNRFTDAGSYVIKAVLERDGYESLTLEATLTIEKAVYDLSHIRFDSVSKTYDGLSTNIELSGILPAGLSVSYIGNGQTHPGTYEVLAQVNNSNSNYHDVLPLSAYITISKKTIEGYQFDGLEVTYDGLSHELNVVLTDPTITVTYLTSNNYINAGSYPVQVVLSKEHHEDLFLEEVLVINQKVFDSSRLDIKIDSTTYNGQFTKPEISLNLEPGLSYEMIGDAVKDAGSYAYVIKFIDQYDNYEAINDVVVVYTINKKPITVVVEDKESIYLDPLKTLTYQIEGEVYDELNPVLTKLGEYNAGIYVIEAELSHQNYDITIENGAYTILKKTIDVTKIQTSDSIRTYDGTKHKVDSISSVPQGITDIRYLNDEKIYPGTYEVTYVFTTDDNHVAVGVLKSKLIIEKASMPNVTISNQTHVYDGKAKSLSITGLTTQYKDTLTVKYLSDSSFIDAGIYPIRFELSHPYYETIIIDEILEISKASLSLDDFEVITTSTTIEFKTMYRSYLMYSLDSKPYVEGYLINDLLENHTYYLSYYMKESNNYLATEVETMTVKTKFSRDSVLAMINGLTEVTIYSRSELVSLRQSFNELSESDQLLLRSRLESLEQAYNDLIQTYNDEYDIITSKTRPVSMSYGLLLVPLLLGIIPRRKKDA